MSSSPAILLVEDDAKLAQLVCAYLRQNNYEPVWVASGNDVLERLQQKEFALVLLDINLPGKSGFEICRSIRDEFAGPILMLTARIGDLDHIQGLELGADDYLCKPLEPLVLLARIRSHLLSHARREQMPRRQSDALLEFGQLRINTTSRQVQLGGAAIHLTTGEFALLIMLAKHAGELVTRERLYEALLHRPYGGMDRTIDGRVVQLRRKLGDDAGEPQRIKTVWAAGYQFVPDAWT